MMLFAESGATFSGLNGFLGTRGSFMMDTVVVAMVAVLTVMFRSIQLAKKQRYQLHKRLQVILGLTLLVAVTAFEIDTRFITDWRARASLSPHYGACVNWALGVHLCFSVTTVPLWVFVIVQGLRKIPNPPGPSAYSRTHIFWARIAAYDMALTAVTGWIFYYLAFVA